MSEAAAVTITMARPRILGIDGRAATGTPVKTATSKTTKPATVSRRLAAPTVGLSKVTVLLTALAFPAAATAANAPLRLRIDNASLVIPPSTLATPDVPRDRPVTITSAVGSMREQAGGTSIRTFLGSVGINANTVTSIAIQAGAGTATAPEVTISGREVREGFDGDALCGQGCMATLDGGADGSTVSFFRPMRSEGDENAADHVRPDIGQSLFVRVASTAPRIAVNLTTESGSPQPGQPVTFRAVLPAGSAATPTFTWYFGDGTSATTSAPLVSHSYAAGNWTAGVLVGDGSGYGATSQTLGVGAATAEPVPTPTPAPTKNDADPPQPASRGGSGGGTSSGEGGDDPSDAARDPAADGDGSARSTGRGAAPTTAAGSAPTATPSPATPQPVPTPAPTTPTRDQSAAPPGGPRIEGRLVDPDAAATRADPLTGALAAADALARQQSAASPEPSGASGGRSMAETAASGMLLLGLLGAGALTELRRSRRPLPLP